MGRGLLRISLFICTSRKGPILRFLFLQFEHLVHWDPNTISFNYNSFSGLCFTLWANEFLGRNSNHQSIIPIPRSDRMVIWGLFRTQSNNKKIFCFPFCAVICSSWLYSSTSFLPSFSFFYNPLRLNGNNKIPFFPYIFIKDFFTLIFCAFT